MNNDPTRFGTIVLGNLAAFEDHVGVSLQPNAGTGIACDDPDSKGLPHPSFFSNRFKKKKVPEVNSAGKRGKRGHSQVTSPGYL
jgi:hypothetical protein